MLKQGVPGRGTSQTQTQTLCACRFCRQGLLRKQHSCKPCSSSCQAVGHQTQSSLLCSMRCMNPRQGTMACCLCGIRNCFCGVCPGLIVHRYLICSHKFAVTRVCINCLTSIAVWSWIMGASGFVINLKGAFAISVLRCITQIASHSVAHFTMHVGNTQSYSHAQWGCLAFVQH